MVYQYGTAIVFLVLAFISQHQADGLECYKCSSLLHSGCHIDWTLGGSDADKYKVECSPAATACQKIVGEIQGSGKQHVYRQCWNQTTMEDYTPTGCREDDIRGSVVCRCTSELCNGQRPLATSDTIYLALLVAGQFFQQLNLLKSLDY